MSDDAQDAPAISEEEMAAFYKSADLYLNKANELVGVEPPARVGAAFLYACARFNAFALQADLEDAGGVADDMREGIVDLFESELSEHLLQRLRNAPEAFGAGGQATGEALDIMVGLNDLDPTARSAFLRLADNFIHIANDMIQAEGLTRASVALVHACTRFNAYVLQREGLEPGVQDQALIADFRQVYSDLLGFHLGQALIASDGG